MEHREESREGGQRDRKRRRRGEEVKGLGGARSRKMGKKRESGVSDLIPSNRERG